MKLGKVGDKIVNFDNVMYITPVASRSDSTKIEGARLHFVGGTTLEFDDPNAMIKLDRWVQSSAPGINQI